MNRKIIALSGVGVVLLIALGIWWWQSQQSLSNTQDTRQNSSSQTSEQEELATRPATNQPADEKPKGESTPQSNSIKLPWLTPSHLMEGKLDDEGIHLGNTAAELKQQFGEPEMIGNYEGAYYGYGDAAFFFTRSIPEEIEPEDKIVKLMLSVQGYDLTRSFMKERFGNPISEGVYGGTDEYLIHYKVGPYTLVATPKDSASKQITVIELSQSKD